ncbi:MAG: hypothetical protein Q8R02_08925 [Hyphomonadaceae bacterium]|nr:hypothetical protein [Hyphomonadaceae bacterium]
MQAHIVQVASRAIAVGALALVISGCSFSREFHGVAVDHNQLVANATNQVTLLNILRASEREPLHFTSISKAVGNAQISGGGSLQIQERLDADTIKTGATGAVTEISTVEGTPLKIPQLQVQLQSGASMDISVYDTQEFYQGIIASVPPSTIAHYLRQRWPSDLLTYLFVGSIEFVAKKDTGEIKEGDLLAELRNEPDDIDARTAFETFVKCYQLTTYQKTGKDRQIVPLSQIKELRGADISFLDGEKFDIDEPNGDKERWIRRKGRTVDALKLKAATDSTACAVKVGEKSVTFNLAASAPSDQKSQDQVNVERIIATGTVNGVETEWQIVLRSTEGIIYFLGEYVRATRTGPDFYALQVSDDTVQPGGAKAKDGAPQKKSYPLLVVQDQAPRVTFVEAQLHGKTWYIPTQSSEGGRSPQIIELVQQLVNLQKSAKERPATQTVRVTP